MTQAFAQRGFSSGEISPSLWPKTDQQKYSTSVAKMRNIFVGRDGGAYNRPGTVYDCPARYPTKTVRLIPFVYNTSQTYVLEFGDQYMRVHQNGGVVVEISKTISNITQANPAVVTSASHGYSNGDQVFITGVAGMAQVNVNYYTVAGVTTNTFQLQDFNGNNIDSTGFSAYTSGGTVARLYTISTPFAYTDLPNVRFVQSADYVTLVHPSYAPQQLVRTNNTNWTMSAISFNPQLGSPTGITGTAGAGTAIQRYQITALNSSIGETMPGETTGKGITGITKAYPAVVTAPSHGFVTGDQVQIQSVSGMVQVNNGFFTVGNTTVNTLELSGIDSSSYTTYTSGGNVYGTQVTLANANAPTAASPNTLSWTPNGGTVVGVTFNVYKQVAGSYILIGNTNSSSFTDPGYTTAIGTATPPVYAFTYNSADGYHYAFNQTGDYPSAVTYYQQRQIFANSNNKPTTVFPSQTGNYNTMAYHTPTIDSDAFTFRMGGTQVNAIQHVLDMGQLLIFTTAGEFSCAGDQSGTLKPSAINLRQYSYNGSNSLRPLVINLTALYVQSQGQIVRDLAYDFVIGGYHGNDLTYWSQHLFEGYTLTDWDYQKTPHSIVWAVRSDGTLLSLTRIPEQQMLAWAHHDVQGGTFENVCCVPEGAEYYLYVVVNRTIGGVTARYVERFATRTIGTSSAKDFNYLDCSSTFDGRNTGSTTMTMSGSADWLYTSNLTLTSSSSYFTSAMATNGDQIQITGADGTIIKCTINAFTSSTVVTAKPNKTVPAAMQNTAFTNWARATTTVTGVWQLNGQNVSVYADGCVVANPNNPVYKTYTVTTGAVTLDKPYTVIKIGLPYTSDLQTLDIDYPQGTIANQNKLIRDMTLHFENSRSIWAGSTVPANDLVPNNLGVTTGANLIEIKLRQYEGYDSPVALQTGKIDLTTAARWTGTGRIFLRNSDPVPLKITGIVLVGEVPLAGRN